MKISTPITSFFPSSVIVPGGIRICFHHDKTPASSCLALIDLSDLEKQGENSPTADILLSFLSPAEKEYYQRYTYAKRKREWLGGRIAAKHAIIALADAAQQVPPNTISILPKQNGSPGVFSSSLADNIPALSISHSGNYAVAMACAALSCGIDIQKVSGKTERVADRFCDAKERELLEQHVPQFSPKEQLTLLWAAKEALKKALLYNQPTIFQGVNLLSIDMDEYYRLHLDFPSVLEFSVQVTALVIEEYILAFTIVENNHA